MNQAAALAIAPIQASVTAAEWQAQCRATR